jgi:hypothetical protein
MTASPITPAPSPAPVTLQPIVQAVTNEPVSAPPPPRCTNDCGFGAAIRNNGCACECDAEAGVVLISSGICVQKIPRRTFNPDFPTCTFEPCEGLSGFVLTSDNPGDMKTCITVDSEACDAACAKTKCLAATTTGTVTFDQGGGASLADPHICVF